MTKDAKNLIVGLDIGTSKVVAVVAEVLPNGRHEVIGLGQHESKGLKKGVVVNIEATVESIRRALEEAELMADCKIRNVYTGIAGNHIRSFNSSGMVAIKDKEVTATDVARVIETAKAVNIPTDQQLLHTVQSGRCPRTNWHERHPTRGESSHRHRRGFCRTEHRQMHTSLRS